VKSEQLIAEQPATVPNAVSSARLLAPVLALMLAAVTLVGITISLAVVELDRAAIAGSQRLAESALRIVRREIALWVKDYAFWDATVQNIVVAPDPNWAPRNVGRYIIETFNMTATIAVDSRDRVIHFALNERHSTPNPGFAEALVGALAPLIIEARAAPLREPVGISGFVELDGALFLAGTAAITSEAPTGDQLKPHARPVLIFVREIDDAVFAELQDRFNLPDLRLVRDLALASDHACPIFGPNGEPIGWVDWMPETPGGTLIDRTLWPLLGIGLALFGLGWLVLRRIGKVNQELREQATALHRANEQLSENAAQVRSALQSAEHATRAKSSFLAGISHELRTPLTAIIGFSQILKIQHRPGKTKSREQEYAEIIHDSSQHLLNLVNDILDLSKIESGSYELDETWIDLVREANAVRALLAHEASRRGIAVSLDLQDQLPALYGDIKGIRQIVINLVSNALKFTDRGGWVRLSMRVESDGGLLLEISDNGAGIPTDEQSSIWEAFKRARNPGLSTAEGAGLGLHLVKILANLHDAEVGLESTLGQGTRVWVAFGPERVRSLVA
jgi:signal transduction histidine kinase